MASAAGIQCQACSGKAEWQRDGGTEKCSVCGCIGFVSTGIGSTQTDEPAQRGGAGTPSGLVAGGNLRTGEHWWEGVGRGGGDGDSPSAGHRQGLDEGGTWAAAQRTADDDLATQAARSLHLEAAAAEQVVGSRRPRRASQNQYCEAMRCTMCNGQNAFQAQDSGGLLQHMLRMHTGQPLREETVAQLRSLDKGVCRLCDGIRSRRTPYCSHCRLTTPPGRCS